MNKRLNIFTAYLMVIIILMGSTGFSVYRHHCNTKNTTSISLFIDLTACEHDHDQDHHSDQTSCCSHEAESACSHEAEAGCCDANSDHTTCNSESSDEDPDCCNTEKKYFKLMVKYDIPTLVVEKVQYIPILLAVFDILTEDISSVEYFKHSLIDSGPPLRYGVDLLRVIHQLKFHI